MGSKCPPYGEFGNVWATGRQPENRIRAFSGCLNPFVLVCATVALRGQRVGNKCPPYGEFGNAWVTGRQPENVRMRFQAAFVSQ
nr:hypothetical protein [uncultured Kingella sp.]